ncbi:MAG: hypothetical protein AAFR84_20415, partial [Pseudomonadota bacterium]
MKLSTRGQTAPFVAMDVLSEATRLEAGGAPVLHMEVGEPAFGAPRAALEALAAAEGRGETLGYTSGLGTARLREAVTVDGRVSGAALEDNQTAAHGLAWLATYVEALRQMQH